MNTEQLKRSDVFLDHFESSERGGERTRGGLAREKHTGSALRGRVAAVVRVGLGKERESKILYDEMNLDQTGLNEPDDPRCSESAWWRPLSLGGPLFSPSSSLQIIL